MARVLILLNEHIVCPEHDLFVCVLLAEEIRQAHAQRLQYIRKRGDGRGGQVPLHLGDKALGKLHPRGKLLLRKAETHTPALYLFAYFQHIIASRICETDIVNRKFRISKPPHVIKACLTNLVNIVFINFWFRNTVFHDAAYTP